MKKSLFSAIPVAIALASVFIACNKENVEPQSSQQPENALQPTDAEVEARILNFKKQLESTEKTCENMTIEDVVWHTEAALNYTHCIVLEGEEIETNTTLLDSAFISITPAENMLTIAQIQEAYNTMENFALGKLKAIASTAKRIAVVDIEYVAEDSDLKVYIWLNYYDINQEQGKVGIYDILPDLKIDWMPGANGCWRWSCDQTISGRGASQVWNNYLNKLIPVYENSYLTDVQQVAYWAYNNPGNGSDTLFYSADSETIPCIDSAEMRYWFDNHRLLFNTYTPPMGWAVANCNYSMLFFENNLPIINFRSRLSVNAGKINKIIPNNN